MWLSLIAASISAPLTPFSDEDSTSDDYVIGDYDNYEYQYDTSEEESPDNEESVDVSERLSGPSALIPRHYLLSIATGQFVAITRSGRVNGNAQIGKPDLLIAC